MRRLLKSKRNRRRHRLPLKSLESRPRPRRDCVLLCNRGQVQGPKFLGRRSADNASGRQELALPVSAHLRFEEVEHDRIFGNLEAILEGLGARGHHLVAAIDDKQLILWAELNDVERKYARQPVFPSNQELVLGDRDIQVIRKRGTESCMPPSLLGPVWGDDILGTATSQRASVAS